MKKKICTRRSNSTLQLFSAASNVDRFQKRFVLTAVSTSLCTSTNSTEIEVRNYLWTFEVPSTMNENSGGKLAVERKKKRKHNQRAPMLPDPKSANRECDISRSIHKERVETGKVVLRFDMFWHVLTCFRQKGCLAWWRCLSRVNLHFQLLKFKSNVRWRKSHLAIVWNRLPWTCITITHRLINLFKPRNQGRKRLCQDLDKLSRNVFTLRKHSRRQGLRRRMNYSFWKWILPVVISDIKHFRKILEFVRKMWHNFCKSRYTSA